MRIDVFHVFIHKVTDCILLLRSDEASTGFSSGHVQISTVFAFHPLKSRSQGSPDPKECILSEGQLVLPRNRTAGAVSVGGI